MTNWRRAAGEARKKQFVNGQINAAKIALVESKERTRGYEGDKLQFHPRAHHFIFHL
jgi:hypothetical protein